MNTQINLKIGDVSDNGQVTILDEDKLSYLVESNSRGAVGIRTISKNLLREYINYLLSHPNATPDEIRGALSGTSDIDKFEYGYTSTLTTMAKMSIANQHRKNPSSNKLSALYPLQQIFYGAPGTGKSHGVKEVTDKVASEFVFRTTFHPDSDYSTFVGAYKPTMTKKAVRNVAGDIVKESGVEVYEPSIVYTFVPQAFLKAYVAAWKNQEQPVFLVIEEINRGNCAQIFGDIFQLLDRNENGESEYPIKPDQDIHNYLAEVFADCDYLPEKIQSGEELLLPKNLYIWATMNTSDQSLFPIDSAFKRRWDWKYVPIAKPDDLDVHIQVGSNEYDWWEFLDTINNHIGEITSSEDKKLGYFFCKACKDDKISTDKFVNKVIFYLWNDVFKDYEVSHEAFKDGTKQLSFAKFFKEDGNANEKTIEKFLQDLGLEPIENILEDSGNEEETMSAEQTADIEQKRYDFWQSFLDYSKNNQEFKELFKRDKPSKVHWYTYGVFKNAKCSMCIEQVRRENKFVISFITTKEIFTKISEYKDEINAKLNGLDLVWMQDLPRSKKESKVVNTFHVNNFEDPTERTQLFEHTIDTLLKMQKVFMEYLQKISQ